MKGRNLQKLTEHIRAAHRIALILHISPDGDACGSAFALRRALLRLDKKVTAVCDQPAPHIYADMDGADALVTPETVAGQRFDLSIAVDVADRARMGRSVSVFDAGQMTAQVDHHQTNPNYAQINFVKFPLSATGVLVMELIDALDVPLDLPLAHCLFVAIATDTGNFKQQNTDPAALAAAARCLEAGVEPSKVTRRVFDMRPAQQVKLIGRAFESMTLHAEGRIALMTLTKQDFDETGALPEHTEGIIGFGINTEGVKMACLMSCPVDKVRCSFRSDFPYDVARVAGRLGGGGHVLAAGCTLDPPEEAARERVLEEMKKELAAHG